MKRIENNSGFTLIELLVVISIIGMLAAVIIVNFSAARERGRDTQRKGNVAQVQNALRLYYNDFGKYPDSSGGNILGCGASAVTACTWGEPWVGNNQTYMEKLPPDPSTGWRYDYVREDLDSFTLTSCLENESDATGETGSISGAEGCTWVYKLKQQ